MCRVFMLVLITLFWAGFFPTVVTGSEEKQAPAPTVVLVFIPHLDDESIAIGGDSSFPT